MSQSRIWVGGAAAVTVLMVIASYFLMISPKMSHASDLRAQTLSTQQSNDQLKLTIAQLKAQFASLPARQAELATIKQQMPSTPNLPTMIRSLSSMSGEAGVTLVSISPSTPAPVTSASSTTAAPSGLFGVPMTVVVQGDYASSELFLQKLQTEMRRAFLVQGLTLGQPAALPARFPKAVNGDVSMSISGEVFVLQASAISGASTGNASSTTTPASAGTAN